MSIFFTLSTKTNDFLWRYMTTFDNLSHVFIFVHLYELQCSCVKMAQNGLKWSKIAPNFQKFPKLPHISRNFPNCPKLPKIIQCDPQKPNIAIWGHAGEIVGNCWRFWAFWEKLGPVQTIWDHLQPIGAIFPQLHWSSY